MIDQDVGRASIYRQIRAQVIEAIATGELSPRPFPRCAQVLRAVLEEPATRTRRALVPRDEGYLIMRVNLALL